MTSELGIIRVIRAIGLCRSLFGLEVDIQEICVPTKGFNLHGLRGVSCFEMALVLHENPRFGSVWHDFRARGFELGVLKAGIVPMPTTGLQFRNVVGC